MLLLLRALDGTVTSFVIAKNTKLAELGIVWHARIALRVPLFDATTICVASMILPGIPDTQKADHWYRLGVLKSNIQKAVRRQNTSASVATVNQMLIQNSEGVTEILRRLPIIMVEDAVLHPQNMSQLVWLMCAHSKGWLLSCDDVQQLLSITASLCSCTRRDVLSKAETTPETVMVSTFAIATDISHTTPNDLRTGLTCLLIRTRFGGMPGDMKFMRELVVRWCGRYMDGTADALLSMAYPVSIKSTAIPISRCATMTAKTMLPEAVDFHCEPTIFATIRTVVSIGSDLTDGQLQDAMWWHRSSLNTRGFLVDSKSCFAEQHERKNREVTLAHYKQIEPHLKRIAAMAWIPIEHNEHKLVKVAEPVEKIQTGKQTTLLSFFSRK